MTGSKAALENPFRLIDIGGLLLACAAGVLATVKRQSLVTELEQQSVALHRLVSQRANQHDAHIASVFIKARALDGRLGHMTWPQMPNLADLVARPQSRHSLQKCSFHGVDYRHAMLLAQGR